MGLDNPVNFCSKFTPFVLIGELIQIGVTDEKERPATLN